MAKGEIQYMDFQQEIRVIRKEKKLTIKELSNLSGVPYTTLISWERKTTQAPINGMAKVLEALGYDLLIVRR